MCSDRQKCLVHQAKVISQQDFENFLEKSKTHLVFVKNLPEDCN